jgi:hypothetical protein
MIIIIIIIITIININVITCPSASSSRCVNMWKTWLDGWCMDTTTALPDCWVKRFSRSISVYAVLESRPDVGSWKRKDIIDNIQRNL